MIAMPQKKAKKKPSKLGAQVTIVTDSLYSSKRRSTGVRTIKVYGFEEKKPPRDLRKIKVLPNPWPPKDIETLITIACTVSGLASVAFRLIKLWVDDRKAQKIRVEVGDVKIEIQGGDSDKKIKNACTLINKVIKKTGRDDLKIDLPSNVDRSIPIEMAREASQEKASKKGSKK